MGFGVSKQVTISQRYNPRTTVIVYSREDTEVLLKSEEPGAYLLYRDHDTDRLYLSVRSIDYVEHHRINFEDNLYYMDNQPYPYLDSIVLYHRKHKLNGTKLTHHAQLSARAVKSFTMKVTSTNTPVTANGHPTTGRRRSVSFASDSDKVTGIEHTNDIVLGNQRISKSSGRLWMSGMQRSMKRVSDSYDLVEKTNDHVTSNGHMTSYESDSDDLGDVEDHIFGNGPLAEQRRISNVDNIIIQDQNNHLEGRGEVRGIEIVNDSCPSPPSEDSVILYCSHL